MGRGTERSSRKSVFNRDNTASDRCESVRLKSARLALWALGLTFYVSTAWAETVTLDGFEFDIPDDWTTQSRELSNLTLAPDSTDASLSAAISARKPTTENQSITLDRWHQSFQASTANRKSTVYSGRLTNGVDAWLTSAVSREEKSSHIRVSLLLEIDGYRLLVSLIAPPDTADQPLSGMAQILTSVRLAQPEKALAASWSAPQQDLSGFYATIGSAVSLSLLARSQHVVGINGLVLTETGHFALTETAMGQDLTGYCEKQVLACGRYETTDNSISTWRSTSQFEHRLGFLRGEQRSLVTEAGGTLVVGGAKYRRIEPNHQAMLDGRFRSARTEQIDGPDGEKLNAYRETLLTFHPDGRFEQTELKALTRASTGTPISLSSAAAPRKGTYQINDYELHLKYANKEPVSHSLFMLQEVPVIDGSMYQRLKPFEPLQSAKTNTDPEKKTADPAQTRSDK